LTLIPSRQSDIEVVHVTDPHLFGDPQRALRGVPTLPALRAVLAAARGHIAAADAILASGDLVNDDPAGYAHFRKELGSLGRPVLCVPGNHDLVPDMRVQLAAPPFQLGGIWDAGNWRVILLDSSVPGEVGGNFDATTLAWLEQALAAADGRHVLVCLHHHPVAMNSRWLDTVGLANGKEFTTLLKRFPTVRGVLFGHVHQQLDRDVDGLRRIATPSTCSQFKPGSDEFAADDTPPAWRRLWLRADGRLESELHWLKDFRP
jgi:3',5'-cyclic-AMP phosphodiesterase